MISNRNVLKEIVKFGKKEYREKKPCNVKVLRIKDETIFTKGEPFKTKLEKKVQTQIFVGLITFESLFFSFFYKN